MNTRELEAAFEHYVDTEYDNVDHWERRGGVVYVQQDDREHDLEEEELAFVAGVKAGEAHADKAD